VIYHNLKLQGNQNNYQRFGFMINQTFFKSNKINNPLYILYKKKNQDNKKLPGLLMIFLV